MSHISHISHIFPRLQDLPGDAVLEALRSPLSNWSVQPNRLLMDDREGRSPRL
jgi:hypothetical protein